MLGDPGAGDAGAADVDSRFSYAAYFCEENAFLLSASPVLPEGARFVVVITNAQRTVPMMNQRAAPGAGPVLWDYHVIVVVIADNAEKMVWDLDCIVGPEQTAQAWFEATFPWPELPDVFQPWFRVVDASEFRAHFSSDRSHMLDGEGKYIKAPPPWSKLGEGAPNLNCYLDLDVTGDPWGEVLDTESFLKFIAP